jgi:hypothetical protein
LERRIACILFPLAALFLLLPLAVVTIPPLHDYPFHLARADIIAAQFGQVDHPTHYRIGSFLLPNVAMDVVTLGLTAFLPPIVAGRVFLALVLLLMFSGVMALHRAVHGRLSPWPLLAAFFLYNFIFLYGFTNYLFGLGMTFWGAAIWLATGRCTALARIAIGTIVGVITLFCHLMAFGLLAAIIGGLAVTEAFFTWRESRRIDLWPLVIAGAPLMITLGVFIAVSPAAGEAAQPFIYHAWIGWKPLMARRATLSPFPWLDLATIGPIAAMLVIGAVRPGLRVSRIMLLPLALLALTFVAMPYSLFGSLYGDTRLPIAVLLAAVAAVDPRPMKAAPLILGSVLAILLLASRQIAIAQYWRGEAAVIESYRNAFDRLPDGCTLWLASAEPFPTLAYKSDGELARWHPPLKHLASLASLDRDLFVPSTWADRFKQPISVRPDGEAARRLQGDNPVLTPTANQLADLVAAIRALRSPGAHKPDFLLLLRPEAISGTPPADLAPFARGDTFALFSVE